MCWPVLGFWGQAFFWFVKTELPLEAAFCTFCVAMMDSWIFPIFAICKFFWRDNR